MTEEKQKILELNVIPAEELLDTIFAPSGTLIDGLMGQGVYILAGAPKVGKSWLVLWLAHQVSKGEPVWGLKTEKCGVLYISLEDTFQRIQQRLNDVSGGSPGSIWLATEALYIGEGFEEQLTNFLAAHPNVKLAVIDTLQRVRKTGQEQYNYASDYETLCALKKIADRFLVTVLVVHNTRKAGSSDSFNMISGTTGLLGCADGALVLQKSSRLENAATLDVTGREIADTQLNLRFDKQRKMWDFVSFGSEAPEKEPDPVLTAVQTFTRQHSVWRGYAAVLLDELKAKTEINAEPNTLTRLLNARVSELEREYGVRYRSGKRTGKGRLVSLLDLTAPWSSTDMGDVDNVGNDGISSGVAGGENTYNIYTTYTPAPDDTEGA